LAVRVVKLDFPYYSIMQGSVAGARQILHYKAAGVCYNVSIATLDPLVIE